VTPEIILNNVGLEFPVYGAPSRIGDDNVSTTVIGGVTRRISKHYVGVTALSDINLHITSGSRLAIVGPNGAGKSTILRVMAGIYHPNNGSVSISGQVSTLFTLNAGADPNLTGYQNIWRLGYLRGMTTQQIASKLDEIVEFAELGDFIHLPNRIYSSGMMTRLDFAISTMSRPDILLIDETFGTGDASFHEKAQRRVDQMIEDSKILVFASHNPAILESFCTHGILLARGRIDMFDKLGPVLECHLERQREAAAKNNPAG
jgi:homopolymeric O-antigen transport system ATP-binding protein